MSKYTHAYIYNYIYKYTFIFYHIRMIHYGYRSRLTTPVNDIPNTRHRLKSVRPPWWISFFNLRLTYQVTWCCWSPTPPQFIEPKWPWSVLTQCSKTWTSATEDDHRMDVSWEVPHNAIAGWSISWKIHLQTDENWGYPYFRKSFTFPMKNVFVPDDYQQNPGMNPIVHSLRIQSMDYLHAFGYARSQSVRPCYLRSDHDFCSHFRVLIFRLISDSFRQIWGRSCWPYHDVSRSVTAFSDNAQDLSIGFYRVSRFVTVCHATIRQFEANMALFPTKHDLRLS